MGEEAGHELLPPDPLRSVAGHPVSSTEQWSQQRRPEILALFREHVYGRFPETPIEIQYQLLETAADALGGKAIRKQVALHLESGYSRLTINVLLYLSPAALARPSPVFLLLNFNGNHTVYPDRAIRIPTGWVPEEFRPAEAFRGARGDSYPVPGILARGYGVVTAYAGDVDPDFDDGFKNGAHGLLDAPGQRPPDSWGTVAAWAWGLSRIMDYLQTDDQIDSKRVAVMGHSRMGKAALWAGAEDERFALVISNNSGCSGAALSRRRHGETVKAINDRFPHWFCPNYRQYNGKEDALPVDQHMLLSLIAPRPLYVASASQDDWADPEGEFLACLHAEPVYRLFGLKGLNAGQIPAPDKPLRHGHIGYHLRSGPHGLTAYDWRCYIDFANILFDPAAWT